MLGSDTSMFIIKLNLCKNNIQAHLSPTYITCSTVIAECTVCINNTDV